MDFYVMVCTYNTYGGHATLSLISDFLLSDDDHFGSAISELSVNFNCPHSGPPRPTLETMFTNFHAHRKSLQKIVFRRKKGQVVIDVASELLDGEDLLKSIGLSLPLFHAGVAETIAALQLLKQRLTAKDDFQLAAFLQHCADAQSRLPSTAQELAALAAESKRRRIARQAAKSPWESLGIDWRDFHPDARQLLDDPFYWENANDFAPNGNDTGADLLANYRQWLRRNSTGDPMVFFQTLIQRWGYPPSPVSDLDQTVWDEAAVALAFAEFKLRADCRPAVAALAREAIERQREQAIAAVNWPHREDRLKSLTLLEGKLGARVDSRADR
jgi:uncharacterized protein YfeS